jgi:hypothetical protein
MLWFGLILIVIGALLFWGSRKSADRVFHMKATETSRIGDAIGLLKEVGGDLPGGDAGLSSYVELKGQLVAQQPVQAQLSGQVAAIVETRVEHVFEEYRESRDSNGNVRGSWSRSSDTMSSDRQESIFELDDGSGRVRVKPGSGVELIEAKEIFQPANSLQSMGGGGMMLSIGGFQLQFGDGGGPQPGFGGGSGFGGGAAYGGGGYGMMRRGSPFTYGGTGFFNNNHRRTLGYRLTENILPLGRHTYALGELASTDEGWVLRAPTGKDDKRPFIVAAKTEEELVTSHGRKSFWLRVGAVVLALGGLALVGAGIAA